MQNLLTDDFVEFTSEDTIDDIFRTYAGDEAIILNSTVNSENYDILNAILIEQLFRYTLKSENNQYHYIFNKLDKMGYIEAFYTFVDCFNKGKISNVDIITAHVDDLKKKYNLQYSGDDMINNLINRMDSFLLMGTNRESDREYFRKYAEKDKLLKKQFEHSQTVPDECCVIKQNVYPKAIDAKIAAQQNAETQAIQNQTNIDKAKADAEAKVTAAQGDADAKVIAAQAEADANAKINSSITDQLIRMKEAEARLKHGWVTVQGSDTVVTKDADSDK